MFKEIEHKMYFRKCRVTKFNFLDLEVTLLVFYIFSVKIPIKDTFHLYPKNEVIIKIGEQKQTRRRRSNPELLFLF